MFSLILLGNCSTEAVKEIFNKLLNARFVERCPAPEPFLEPPSEDEPPAKKRGAKTTKVVTFCFCVIMSNTLIWQRIKKKLMVCEYF